MRTAIKTTAMKTNPVKTIKESTVLIRLAFERAGNLRQMKKCQFKSDADSARTKGLKYRFESPEYAAVGSYDGAVKAWLMSRAIPCGLRGYKGLVPLPIALLPEVEKTLAEAALKREALIQKFFEVYDNEREVARERLRSVFTESDYPPVEILKREFSMWWGYIEIVVPKNLPPEVMKREEDKLAKTMLEMGENMKEALRETFVTLTGKLVENLTPKEDGTKQRFYDSFVENLVEFLQLFSVRNVANDTDLMQLAAKAEGIIKTVADKPGDLRKKNSIRKVIRQGMDEVTKAATKLIEASPRRKINLEGEE